MGTKDVQGMPILLVFEGGGEKRSRDARESAAHTTERLRDTIILPND